MCGQDDVLCETKYNTHIIPYKYHVPLIAKIPPFEIMMDFLCLMFFFIQNHVIIYFEIYIYNIFLLKSVKDY
jgi:hypothetical protein